MFTGIIESKGQVTGREAGEALTRITIDTGNLDIWQWAIRYQSMASV